jgi:AcrR family transcriptional regulator
MLFSMKTTKSASRGDITREKLLASAMEIFGRAGYDAASNRAIADAAGTNQALIGYHFGSKRGLYIAVFEFIAAEIQLELLPLVEAVRADFNAIHIDDPDRRERCVTAIETLLFAMLDNLSRPESKSRARLVMREQQDPSDAFEILYDGFMQRMLGTLSFFIAGVEGIDSSNAATNLRAIFLFGQVLVFVLTPAIVDRHLALKGGTAGNLKTIKNQLHLILQQQFIGGETQ